MTLYEFKVLERDAQVQYTWDTGIWIGFREEATLHMVLYRVENFYVELQYYTDLHEIATVKSFISDEQLQPYLERIDISELLQQP